MKTAAGLGVELTIDHEPVHSNILAGGLSRHFPATLSQFGPALRVSFTVGQLLTSERPWSFWPKEAPWPDTLLRHWRNHPIKNRKGRDDRPSSQCGVWVSTRPPPPWKLDVSGIRCSPRSPSTCPVSHLCLPRFGHVPSFDNYRFIFAFLPRVPSLSRFVANRWRGGGDIPLTGTSGGAVGGIPTSGSGGGYSETQLPQAIWI